MLRTLSLRNFKSILDDTVTFSPTGLTALVGANGSGKTNIVKALQFLSATVRNGIEWSVINEGGRNGILPKSIPARELHRAVCSISYDFELVPPPQYPRSFDRPLVRHSFDLSWKSARSLAIPSESIRCTQVWPVGRFIRLAIADKLTSAEAKEFTALDRQAQTDSVLSFKRTPGGQLDVAFEGAFDVAHAKDYLYWIGLGDLPSSTPLPQSQEDFLALMRSHIAQYGTSATKSWRPTSRPTSTGILEGGTSPALNFLLPTAMLRSFISAIRCYDLHLLQLQQPQPASSLAQVDTDGSNLPSVHRVLKLTASSRRAYDRLWQTERAIAPHVRSAQTTTLVEGKEVLRFTEVGCKRPVESWEASDGTLRALAILLALESHPVPGLAIIEEPERCLHPWAVRTLVDHIREVIGERPGLQVLLTTHSEHLLSSLKPQEVLVLERDPESGTHCQTVAHIHPNLTDMHEIGRLWVEGLLGGVPRDS